jgi:SAM-dependent MidA family methyltransferase
MLPASGSDFVTAPELSPLFGRALAVQVAQALDTTEATHAVWEFGAGSGALAAQLLGALGDRVQAYHVVELSGALRQRQQACLQPWAGRVHWHDALPERWSAWWSATRCSMRCRCSCCTSTARLVRTWRGAVRVPASAWADRPTPLRPPAERSQFVPGALTEIHPQAEAFVRTLADRLQPARRCSSTTAFPSTSTTTRSDTAAR